VLKQSLGLKEALWDYPCTVYRSYRLRDIGGGTQSIGSDRLRANCAPSKILRLIINLILIVLRLSRVKVLIH